MEDDPQVVAQLKANPLFELESHSYLHPHLTQLSDASLQSEVDRSQADFERLVGRKATLFRAPYAELDGRVVALLKRNGLTPIQYDLASGDPDKKFTKKVLVPWVVKHAKAGSIVVMHMNGRGWHTAESLPDIIDGLRKRGFELVRVGDLLAPPRSPSAPD
jgi:peptidoglycan/xylan/chitin deacetylase (PgdA/CDA1 family)